MDVFCNTHGRNDDEDDAHVFSWETERKKLLGRPRRREESNTLMDLKEMWYEIVGLIHLFQDWDQLLKVWVFPFFPPFFFNIKTFVRT
jgi:hypothetical protein